MRRSCNSDILLLGLVSCWLVVVSGAGGECRVVSGQQGVSGDDVGDKLTWLARYVFL